MDTGEWTTYRFPEQPEASPEDGWTPVRRRSENDREREKSKTRFAPMIRLVPDAPGMDHESTRRTWLRPNSEE